MHNIIQVERLELRRLPLSRLLRLDRRRVGLPTTAHALHQRFHCIVSL